MSDIILIPLGRLRPDPHQARRTFQRIAELAESIATYGLLENLVVRDADPDGIYEIKAGERRFRALRLLKEQGRLKSDDVALLRRPHGRSLRKSCRKRTA